MKMRDRLNKVVVAPTLHFLVGCSARSVDLTREPVGCELKADAVCASAIENYLTAEVMRAVKSAPSQSDRSNNAWTVEQVVASLKEGHEPSVSFEEATYSSLLTEPLIVRGTLRFTPPSTLEKEVLEIELLEFLRRRILLRIDEL